MVAPGQLFPFRDDLAQVRDPGLRADLGILDIEAVFLFQETDQLQPVDGGKAQVGHQQGFFADLRGSRTGNPGKQVDQAVPADGRIASLQALFNLLLDHELLDLQCRGLGEFRFVPEGEAGNLVQRIQLAVGLADDHLRSYAAAVQEQYGMNLFPASLLKTDDARFLHPGNLVQHRFQLVGIDVDPRHR